MKHKKKLMNNDITNFGLSTAKMGISFGVAGAAGAMSPVPVTGGLSTAASFMPMAGTMVGAGYVLKKAKKLKKYY